MTPSRSNAGDAGWQTADRKARFIAQIMLAHRHAAVGAARLMLEDLEREGPPLVKRFAQPHGDMQRFQGRPWPAAARRFQLTRAGERELLEPDVAAGERALGPATFTEEVGHFWLLLESGRTCAPAPRWPRCCGGWAVVRRRSTTGASCCA